MTVQVERCPAPLWPQVLTAIDAAFVYGKGREVSLARRFPSVFGAPAGHAVRILRAGTDLLACLALREFTWQTTESLWRGVMIGAVCTLPAQRGHGHGLRLLEAVIQEVAASGSDFVVLFTSLEGYYERLGFVATDSGCFGTAAPLERLSCERPVRTVPLDAVPAAIGALHAQGLAAWLTRSAADWRSLPLPVTQVALHVCDDATGAPVAYALAGLRDTSAFLYELAGAADCYEPLWQRLSRHAAEVFVNDRVGSASRAWLDATRRTVWTAQRQARWLPCSERARHAPWASWHVPFFDRI